MCWKKEFVTFIPKGTNLESLSDLQNIPCTLLASEVYKSYVLDWLKEEVKLRSNQYGGVRGLGTEQVLVQMWQENSEDYRASTVITSTRDGQKWHKNKVAVSYTHLTLPTTPYV